MSVSNNITAFLNFLAFMCSIPITTAGIWLAFKQGNECVHWLRWPIVIIGVSIMLVSLTGFVGAHWKREGLLSFYLVCMAILIVLVLFVLVFAFVVTRPSGAYGVQGTGRGFAEYRLEGYSSWLRNHFTSSDNWEKIRACLAGGNMCRKLNSQYFTVDQFFAANLSPLQSGCCKPPSICGYQYVNPTVWSNPANVAADPDCSEWNNDSSQLCYDCNSCKAGLLGSLRREWRKSNQILIIAVVVLITVYIIACSACRNAQTEDIFRGYRHGWA